MRALALSLLPCALVACDRNGAEHTAGSAAPPAGSAVAAADPWQAKPTPRDPNALPTIAERHARAEKICPTVTPYFFEVTKNGKTSHLLGTRHIGVPFAKMPPIVHAALHSAKLAIFEISPDDKGGFDAPPEPLRDELGSADWTHFTELVGSDTAGTLVTATPESAVLEMLIEYEDVTAILDKEIQIDALGSNIATGGLETSDFQDHVLAKMLDLRQLKATIETTKDRAEIDSDGAKDLREYCAGTEKSPGMDDEARGKMKKAGYTDAELDQQDDTLVYSRNRDWIPKLDKLFAQGDVFVAVGADHLIGDRGVIALLAKAGYATKRLTPPAGSAN